MRPLHLASVTLVASLAAHASAQHVVFTRVLAEWTDPTTIPQTRTECTRMAEALGVKTCVEWKTQVKTMQVKAVLEVTSPDPSPSDAIRRILDTATASFGKDATPADVAKNIQSALQQAQLAFAFSVRVYTTTDWSDWH